MRPYRRRLSIESKASKAGRPREEAYERLILQAGYEELATNGLSHFSVAAVARRSGVARGTVYLRWPTREDLIVASAAVISLHIVSPPEGNLEGRLRFLAAELADAFARPDALRVLLRIDADRELQPALFRRIYSFLQGSTNKVMMACVRDAQASGEIRADVSPMVFTRAFVGAMFVEALSKVPTRRVDKDFMDSLVLLMAAAVNLPDSP
ncbi:MAG: hypothetical protein JWP10_499 [Nocardioidaceae bacterium]|nr:hypothetical protein [Nocardioidaceae bacterium]